MKASGDSRERAEAVSDACPHIEKLVACESCIAQAIEAARLDEREECCAAMCEWCRDKVPVRYDEAEGDWYHVEDDDPEETIDCDASAIRARGSAQGTPEAQQPQGGASGEEGAGG